MTMYETPDAAAELVDFWNDILVPKFMKYRHILVGGLTHHSAAILPSLPLAEGDRVLDVGCGFGDTAIHFAKRVAPTGSVVGIDCCEAFLEIARGDAAACGVTNAEFVMGDAQFEPFDPVYDFCFSRFGTMFFENPVAGMRNMRQALKPGGQFTMIVWRRIEDNPWLALPKEIVLRYLPPPGEDARTCGPGPFSMANQDMVTGMLKSAGLTDIHFERVDAPIMVGRSPDDAMGFQLALGPAGEVFREAGDEAERRREEIEQALSEELSRFATDEGIVLPSSSWKVSARHPQ